MRVFFLCVTAFLCCLILSAAPPDLITCSRALEFAGETTRSGSVSVEVVPIPDSAEKEYTLRLRFRLQAHNTMDWVDAIFRPSPGLDFSGAEQVRLWLKAEQETSFLVLKMTDPDNPGSNQSLFESALQYGEGPLPAGKWVAVDVPLPADPKRRDDVCYIGFYISASDQRVPLNQDIIVSVGRFSYSPPPRAPWPPARTADREAALLKPVATTPLTQNGPWQLVGGDDNQTDHLASFLNGAVMFRADATGWNEFLWSDPQKLVIKPLATYRLQFDYDVIEGPGGGNGAMFYSLVRAKGTIREDVGWQRWEGSAGTRGRRTVTFTTHDAPGYYLNFGIRHHGAIRLKDICLWELPEERN